MGQLPACLSARRRVAAGVLLATAVLALTGCVKADIALTVSDDRVSGTMILAVNRQVIALSGQSEEQFLDEMTNDAPIKATGVSAQRYDDGTYLGTKITLDRVSLAEFNKQGSDPDDLSISHEGDRYRVHGVVDLSDVDLTSPPLSALGGEFSIVIAVTFPGEVLQHNGQLSGTTVTWQPQPGTRTVLDAQARDRATLAWRPILAVVIPTLLVLVLAGAGVLWALLRGRRRAQADH